MKYRAVFITEESQSGPVGTSYPIGSSYGIIESWDEVKPTDGAIVAAALDRLTAELKDLKYAVSVKK